MFEARLSRWPLYVGIVLVIGVTAGIFFTRAQAQYAPSQPFDFSHQMHTEEGIQCLFCHSSAARSDIAGIPSVQKCMGCHEVIATDSEAVQELAGYWEREEPILWNRVDQQPDFVYFSHQPHLTGGISCETCHGAVSQMDIVSRATTMDMGWCLECHLAQPEDQVERLADCLTCHK